jgi:hypothetical protein
MDPDLNRTLLKKDLDSLDSQIFRVIGGIVAAMVFALLLYWTWFGLKLGQPLAENPANWGTFGDYFGGLLNPIIAFTALYWLTRSVRLQKEELNETRAALEDAATAQRDQVQVASWTALINANTAQVQYIQHHLAQKRQRLTEMEPRKGEILTPLDIQSRMKTKQTLQTEIESIEKELVSRSRLGADYEENLKGLTDRLSRDAC